VQNFISYMFLRNAQEWQAHKQATLPLHALRQAVKYILLASHKFIMMYGRS